MKGGVAERRLSLFSGAALTPNRARRRPGAARCKAGMCCPRPGRTGTWHSTSSHGRQTGRRSGAALHSAVARNRAGARRPADHSGTRRCRIRNKCRTVDGASADPDPDRAANGVDCPSGGYPSDGRDVEFQQGSTFRQEPALCLKMHQPTKPKPGLPFRWRRNRGRLRRKLLVRLARVSSVHLLLWSSKAISAELTFPRLCSVADECGMNAKQRYD